MALDEQLRSFASLVSLVLIFVVLFTNHRWGAAAEIRRVQPPRGTRVRALLINASLLVVTAGLFATGMPLVIDALGDPNVLRVSGAVRTAFVLVWLLLAGLLCWQMELVRRSSLSALRTFVWWVKWRDRRRGRSST